MKNLCILIALFLRAMRLLILFFLLSFVSCSRYVKTDGTYFSAEQDCLFADGKKGLLESKCTYILEGMYLREHRNVINFFERKRFYNLLHFWRNRRRYRLKVLHRGDDSLLLMPASRLARKYFDNRKTILFKTRNYFADPTNTFTKIIFHSGRCYGCCPEMHLELDYSGNLKVTNNGSSSYYGCPDSSVRQSYYGKVSFTDLDRLKRILQTSQLKTLDWPSDRRCSDAPDYNLIIYSQGRRYQFKINSACEPVISRRLTFYLDWLFRYPALKKITTAYTYEQ